MTEEIIQKKEYWVEFISFSKKHCNYTDEDLAEHIVKMINKAINYTPCCDEYKKQLLNNITCDECGNTGRGEPTLQEPDGVDCEKCSNKQK